MAAKGKSKSSKKKPSGSVALPAPLNHLFALVTGPGRSVALGLLTVAVVVGVWMRLWQVVRADLLAGDEYQVAASDLDITPLPDWIRTDPREKAYGYITLRGPLSVMDDDAAQRVAEAFQIHPWVEKVLRVTKHHPARIRVELQYRRPVCMVHCNVQGQQGLLPVDAGGVWLPGDDLSEVQANRYPIVMGIKSAPVGLPGMPWRDNRVVGAARIAEAFGPAWYELRLHEIKPAGRVSSGRQAQPLFHLATHQGRQIIWGAAPGVKVRGEPSAQEKIERLRRHAAVHGSLDGGQAGGPIDLRRAAAPVAARPSNAHNG